MPGGECRPMRIQECWIGWSTKWENSNVDVLIGYFRWISTADAAPYLSRIRAPVLGIYPNGGVVTDDGQLDLLRSKIGNIRIVRLQTDSHLINVTHAATCALEVLHFISQHDGIICREQ